MLDLSTLPKAELHLHLEGAMRPSTAAELADRYGLAIPRRGSFADFADFAVAYEQTRELVQSLDDLRRVATEIIDDARTQGISWTELHVSPTTYAGRFGHDEAILDAVLDGMAAAGDDLAAGAVIVGVNRTMPLEFAYRAADLAIRYAGSGVVGLGLVADEANHPPERFANVFAKVRAAGVPALPHAGEGAGPDSIRTCVEVLGARRVCHGVRAVEDPSLVDLLAERQVCLDVCPTSNVALGIVPSYAAHPLPQLVAAGVPVSIGSDCPLIFDHSLIDEYGVARDQFGFDDATLEAIAATSLAFRVGG